MMIIANNTNIAISTMIARPRYRKATFFAQFCRLQLLRIYIFLQRKDLFLLLGNSRIASCNQNVRQKLPATN